MQHRTIPLSQTKISEILQSKDFVCDVTVLQTVDSTNTEAKRLAATIDDDKPRLILAESQTNGKGRMGRSFYSPKSTGLYMSYMYTPKTDFADSVTVTAAASVAVVRAIETLTNLSPKIKWVNDIYIDSKKVCGILTEAVTGQTVKIIVGIGINITTEVFPDNVSKIATALNTPIDRNTLAATIIAELQKLITELPKRTFLEEYREKSLVLGKEVVFYKNDIDTYGTAIDIDQNGALIVQTSNGNITLNTGEISLRVRG